MSPIQVLRGDGSGARTEHCNARQHRYDPPVQHAVEPTVEELVLEAETAKARMSQLGNASARAPPRGRIQIETDFMVGAYSHDDVMKPAHRTGRMRSGNTTAGDPQVARLRYLKERRKEIFHGDTNNDGITHLRSKNRALERAAEAEANSWLVDLRKEQAVRLKQVSLYVTESLIYSKAVI